MYEAIDAIPTLNILQKMQGLNQYELEEKQRIQSTGFKSWSQKDFSNFCNALLKFHESDY